MKINKGLVLPGIPLRIQKLKTNASFKPCDFLIVPTENCNLTLDLFVCLTVSVVTKKTPWLSGSILDIPNWEITYLI